MKQIVQLNMIPTGRRQTSWLFTSMSKELNEGRFRFYRGQSWTLIINHQCNHLATLPPYN